MYYSSVATAALQAQQLNPVSASGQVASGENQARILLPLHMLSPFNIRLSQSAGSADHWH
ncbi:MAG: hypothetical protein CL577_06950 [Alteromonadaceae bacterium]|nr:hypothetical protein [Alteromonadaceae bacterium]HBN89245.1 hypothetical protein [Rheinheimera sp.]